MKFKDVFSSLKQKTISLFGKNKKILVSVVVLISIIALYFVFFPVGNSGSEDVNDLEKKELSPAVNFTTEIENKIESMLLSISEVTNADVMIFCESTEIYEYLKNIEETKSENGSTTKHEEVAYEKNGSNSTPIIITTKLPKIVGVWIIINSVSASTKLAITNSVKSVLNVDESCISILQER